MGDVILGSDFKRHTKPVPHSEQTLEQQAIEIMTMALMGDGGVPPGMEPVIYIEIPSDTIYESSLGFYPRQGARIVGWFGEEPPEPIVYQLQLVDPKGKVVKSRPLRIYMNELKATEYHGHCQGLDLARDAIWNEGLWELFEMQEKAKRERGRA